MGKGVCSLEEISGLNWQTSEISVVKDDEVKVVKTVDRADIACVVAYMLGVPDSCLDEYYIHRHSTLLDEVRNDRDLTIIRYLSKIRTAIMANYLAVDNEIRFNLSNIDRMEYFDKNEINVLQKWGVRVVQPNYRSEKYLFHITRLIDEYIDNCKKHIPESVKYDYIRQLFVSTKYRQEGRLSKEYNRYKGMKNLYPFQCFMFWKPTDCGNMLYNDAKFLNVLYAQHNEEFYEGYKYKDATDDTKQSIYDFIRNSKKVVMVVDCENSDPYKLYGMLKNLNSEDIKLISKIILYDDYHTTIAWDYISTLTDIPVEHIEVSRVTDCKSLVDIKMSVGVSAAYYRDNIDSFVLCSSDSDFWGLISSIPEARFLVMYEYSKCGVAIKQALKSRNIYHFAMDDFYMANATDLQKIVLKRVLQNYLPKIIGENGWELTKRIYSDAYIYASDAEMQRFYEKYIKRLRLKMDKHGNFYIMYDD